MDQIVQIKEEKPATQRPGFVEFKTAEGNPQLDDLWFMVGSRCNLSCSHCYVASSPTNDTLQQITFEEANKFIQEATKYGVKMIYFTGGEPFINRDMFKMLEASLQVADVTVLSNATYPIMRFIEPLKELEANSPHKLNFRISIDHYEREKHDAVRGKGMYDLTVKNTIALKNAGFHTIITASAVVYENNPNTPEQIEANFKKVFAEQGVDIEVKLLPFNLEMGSNLVRIKAPSKHVFISEDCMKRPGITNEMFQCFNGRTVQKINGKMIVYPCPIIYNDRRFELAENLADSFKKVHLTHKACFDFCYKSKGKCTN